MGVETNAVELPGYYQDCTFRCHFGQNGVAELSPYMTPSGGGTAELPAFRFIGGMASDSGWPSWDYPVTPYTLARTADGGGQEYNNGSPYFGPNNDSIKPNNGDYFQAIDFAFGQIGTEDFVIELVVNNINTSAQNSFFMGSGGATSGAGNIGYEMIHLNAGIIYGPRFNDGVGGGPVVATAGSVAHKQWYHFLVFVDRDGSATTYVDGVQKNTNVISACQGTLTSGSDAFRLAAAGHTDCETIIAYVALWKKYAWLTSHLNPDTAKQRFGLLAGYWPQVAKGTATPTVRTRAYAAYTEKIEGGDTRLYYCGGEHLRLAQRVDGNSETVTGYLDEPQSSNDIDQSCTFAGYALEDGGDSVNDNNDTSPDNQTRMAALVCDSTNGNHGISDATPGNLAATLHCFSAYVGEGNADWVKLEDTTVANCYAWFRLSTGTLGSTPGAGISETGWVGGTYRGPSGVTVRRPYIRFTGTVAPHTFRIRPVDADNGDTFSGGNGADVTLHLWGWQCEEGDYPTSLIETAGAAATRLKDQLQFKADDGNLGGVGSEERGTVEFTVLAPSTDNATARTLLTVSDGGSGDDRITIQVTATGYIELTIIEATVTTVDLTGTTVSVVDGVPHRVRVTWTTDDVRLFVDSTLEDRDIGCAIPDNLDEMDIGQNRSSAAQPGYLLSDIKFWKRNRP